MPPRRTLSATNNFVVMGEAHSPKGMVVLIAYLCWNALPDSIQVRQSATTIRISMTSIHLYANLVDPTLTIELTQ